MGFILGGGTLGIISKVKWRIASVGIRQSLGGNRELGQKKEETLKLFLGAISSTDSLNWVGVSLRWLRRAEWEGVFGLGFYLCNNASRAPHLLNDFEGEISAFTGDNGYD